MPPELGLGSRQHRVAHRQRGRRSRTAGVLHQRLLGLAARQLGPGARAHGESIPGLLQSLARDALRLTPEGLGHLHRFFARQLRRLPQLLGRVVLVGGLAHRPRGHVDEALHRRFDARGDLFGEDEQPVLHGDEHRADRGRHDDHQPQLEPELPPPHLAALGLPVSLHRCDTCVVGVSRDEVDQELRVLRQGGPPAESFADEVVGVDHPALDLFDHALVREGAHGRGAQGLDREAVGVGALLSTAARVAEVEPVAGQLPDLHATGETVVVGRRLDHEPESTSRRRHPSPGGDSGLATAGRAQRACGGRVRVQRTSRGP